VKLTLRTTALVVASNKSWGEDQEGGVDGRGGRQAVDQLLQVEGTVVDLEKHFWQTLQQIYLNLKSSEAR
jgi:hypothetical protein